MTPAPPNMHITSCLPHTPCRTPKEWLHDTYPTLQVADLLPDECEGAGEAGSTGSGVSVGQVQELLSTGLAIELQLDSRERLQTILREHSEWELHMKQVLEGDVLTQLLWYAAYK